MKRYKLNTMAQSPDNTVKKSLLRQIKGYTIGCSYVFIWYSSILLGFYFLCAPLLPLLFVNRKLYRKATDTLYSTWEAFNVSLLQMVYGMKLILTGDNLEGKKHSLLIVNHPTRTDWNFLWAGLLHAAPNHNAKIVLKDQLRSVPGIGWVMAMTRFLYLKRKWSVDSVKLDQMLDYFSSIREEGGKQIILFPEGTNLTVQSREKSAMYAMRYNREVYQYLIHPRNTGFVHLAKGMMDRNLLDNIYDVTIAYRDNLPISELHLLSGDIPSEVHIQMIRHPLSSLPTTMVGLEKWLDECWRKKEKLLTTFYSSGAQFPCQTPDQIQPCSLSLLQPLCLVVCLSLLVWGLVSLMTNIWLWVWVALVTIVILVLEKREGGVQQLEMDMENVVDNSKIFCDYLKHD